ncbi:hypothetical protein ACHWQZ_G007917 [Mnemiopsis leidyi]
MSDKVKLRKSSEKLVPDLVKSLEHLGSSEYWRYYEYDYDTSDSDSDTRSSYSIASLTFQRDRRGMVFPDIVDKHSKACNSDSNYKLAETIALPDISSCVVMTSRRRMKSMKKKKKKPRKKSARYFPEISNEAARKEKEALDFPRSMSSAEEYSPILQRKKKAVSLSSKHRHMDGKDEIKLPNI